MKIPHFKIQLTTLFIISIITSWSPILGIEKSIISPECRNYYLSEIEQKAEQRWQEEVKNKKTCSPYARKKRKALKKEFQSLKNFRSRWTDFNYTALPNSEANTILIHGHHFIGLPEPTPANFSAFFDFLVTNEVSVLIRTNPEHEYIGHHQTPYCQDHIVKDDRQNSFIQSNNFQIPYLFTDQWSDGKALAMSELYRLVQNARGAYAKSRNKGPIAVHCRAGRGRTGTFIAAYVLANMLDVMQPNEISIEEIVLRLSTQRRNQVATSQQYASLYSFTKYYLKQKQKDINKAEKKRLKRLKVNQQKAEQIKKNKIVLH